jgi:hypothetical protein
MAHRVLVVSTSQAPEADIALIVRQHAGPDAEVQVVAPASKVSRLHWLTNDEDAARSDAADRAQKTAAALPGNQAEPHVGDVEPLKAIEDALRLSPADEIILLTAPDEDASWLEAGLADDAQERFSVPVTHLVAR